MKNFLIVVTIILSVFFGGNAKAGLITVSIDQNSVGVGETVEVTLYASGFDSFDIFDLNVNFDTSMFSFLPLTFMSDLPSFGLLSNQVASGVAISFLDFFPSSGDFLLAKFELTALLSGFTNFDLVVNEFALSDPFDIFALATPVNAGVSGQASATVASVPEPSTLAIFALGMMGLASRRFKKQ